MRIWLGPDGEVAQEVEARPRYLGADRVLRAVYVWLAMEWATHTVMESWYTQARQEDAARERARELGAELAKSARVLVDEIDFEEWDCDLCKEGVGKQPDSTKRAARALDDVLVRIDMERSR